MNEKIPYIAVSYLELRDMEYTKLEEIIDANLLPFFNKINTMNKIELSDLCESIKQIRKQNFRFTNKTDDIEKIRIQLALSKLANLFRMANNKSKKSSF